MPKQAKFQLTEGQKSIIRSFFVNSKYLNKNPDDIVPEPPRLSEIMIAVFGESFASVGSSLESYAIRKYCKQNSWEYSNNTFGAKGMIILTQDQKNKIKEYSIYLKPIEVARKLFNNDKLTPFSQEHRTVKYYINNFCKSSLKIETASVTLNGIKMKTKLSEENGELKNEKRRENNDDMDNNEITKCYNNDIAIYKYKPPKNLKQTIERINGYLNYAWVEETMKKQEKYYATKLQQYLNSFRFNHQINTYKLINDRNLFEDSFIRYTYDKPDLTQEEIDQFITVCIHVVLASEIQFRIESLKIQGINCGGLSPQMNDSINNLQNEYHQCILRQQKLYSTLTGERKSRLEQREDNSIKITNLVAAWKNEEFRIKTIHLAELEKKRLIEEADKINSWSSIHALLHGASYEELVT